MFNNMRTGIQSMCGCYYVPSSQAYKTEKYLPQIDLKVHTTVLSTASRTVLSQVFLNPSSTEIKECKYVFPLYDGVSIVGFTCQIGSRIISGVVKEKAKAKEEYDAAVEHGETAGLLEQGATSDVFMTSLGNIPAGETLLVTITYIGELKHDVGADGIRFTIPTKISPRYGQAGMDQTDLAVMKGGIAITVDVNMPEESPLQELRSPSHPIAVALGRTSTSESLPPHLSRASATLSLGTSALDRDFILEIMHQDSDKPKAVLETHPTIPGQRALMATLVPKTNVQQSKAEVIFVADQSGSMQGARTATLVAALRVFLKSLPVGIKFNICYFGTSHSFLFPESQVYDQQSLGKALKSLDVLHGNYGGTQTLSAVRASLQSRDSTQPLSMILATDGDIWQQQELFDYLNDSVAASKKTLRIFALGIGDSVSSALVEGVARAGNGFAQSVGQGEKLDGKVIRLLRGALTPDHGAFTMEIQYHKDEDEDDFVMVERVSDSLRVMELDENEWPNAQLGEEVTASAQTTAGRKKDVEMAGADGQIRSNHLPAVPVPKLMQTPQNIPPLYPFSRTNIYVLISPQAAQGSIKSVILKGSRIESPFEMEIPVEVLLERGEIIHQLAAKKAVAELEEGRGWLVHAKDEKGVLIKEKYPARFPKLVEREAVRLGMQYKIAGKFTSFVATETDPENPKSTVSHKSGIIGKAETVTRSSAAVAFCAQPSASYLGSSASGGLFGNSVLQTVSHSQSPQVNGASLLSAAAPSRSSGLFGNSVSQTPLVSSSRSAQSSGGSLFGASASNGSSGLFGSLASAPQQCGFGAAVSSGSSGLFGSLTSTRQPAQEALFNSGNAPREQFASTLAPPSSASRAQYAPAYNMDMKAEETDPLQKIIALQTFEGYWNLEVPLLDVVGLSGQHNGPQGVDSKVWATVLAITFLEGKMAGDKESWEMLVEKARAWLEGTEKEGFEGNWTLAKQLVMGPD